MKKSLFCATVAITVAFCAVLPTFSWAGESKLNDAIAVLQEIQSIPEKGIPSELFRDARGIAIIPDLIKAGFIVGARYGRGVLVARRHGRWSAPVFIMLEGGSVGYQIGVESTDIILVFKTARSLRAFGKGRFTFGAEVTVAAGPVGRHAEAATDLQLQAEIYSYSKSRGLFGGVAIEGAALAVDNAANSAFYGRSVSADEILAGKVRMPKAAIRFSRLLQRYARR